MDILRQLSIYYILTAICQQSLAYAALANAAVAANGQQDDCK
jgi:hypothetical protein